MIKKVEAVQYEDVAQAAVKLLVAGRRPTVRAIREVVGRGSPNVILPLLTAWFASLGKLLASDPVFATQALKPAIHPPVASVWSMGDQAADHARVWRTRHH